MRLAVLWVVLLGLHLTLACKSKSEEPPSRSLIANNDEEELDNGENDDSEDEDDETAEDVSQDDEDFDLICDSYIKPNRSRTEPDIIIIGAKKGGTRALIEFLKLHPSLKSAGPEIHFFDRKSNYDKGMDWYVSKMPQVTPDQLAMEKTPGYFHHPLAAQRIARVVANAKLLLILRDPAKRLISDYNQFRSKHLDEGKTYPPLEELIFTPEGNVDITYPPVQRSIYHHHMSRWFRYFPKEQIHVVHGEKFIEEPWAELQKVEEFLQVENVITQDNFFFNGTKGFYCSQDKRVTGIWECTKKKCLGKSKGRPKPPLQEGTLEKLREFFKEHNKIFYELMGKDFGWV